MQLLTNYSNLIENRFKFFGFESRDYQIKTINQILNQFIDHNIPDVVLNAPTGAGKSVIGIVVSACLDYINKKSKKFIDENEHPILGNYILIHVNTLVDQYDRTIENVPSSVLVMGSSNYECPVHDLTAEYCTFYEDAKNEKVNPMCYSGCEYRTISNKKKVSNSIVTNYSYYMSAPVMPKLTAVYDEAHLLNDAYVNHNNLTIDEIFIKANFSKHISGNDLDHLYNELKYVTSANYFNFLDELITTFKTVITSVNAEIKELTELEIYDDTIAKKLSRTKSKFNKLFLKMNTIKKYLNPTYTHSFKRVKENPQYKTKDAMILSPIYIKNEIDEFNKKTKYRLYMSATNPMIYYKKKLNLEKVGYVRMPSVFHPNTKKICFLNIGRLNNSTMGMESTRDNIISACYQISEKYKTKNGVIHIPSFKVGDMIYEELKDDFIIHYQKSGTKLVDVLQEFLEDERPCILMTPSGWEGLDFKYDAGTWQIVVKAPYASRADARIEYIIENDPDIYQMDTLVKLIQAGGRCTRAADDESITFCLGNALTYMFNDNVNIWRNEFKKVPIPGWINKTWK